MLEKQGSRRTSACGAMLHEQAKCGTIPEVIVDTLDGIVIPVRAELITSCCDFLNGRSNGCTLDSHLVQKEQAASRQRSMGATLLATLRSLPRS